MAETKKKPAAKRGSLTCDGRNSRGEDLIAYAKKREKEALAAKAKTAKKK